VSTLFMVNIPYNCTESELQAWVESRGIGVKSVRLVQDLVAGVSPGFAYVEMPTGSVLKDAIATLNGRSMRDRVILVSEARRRVTAA
jgi:RNA recognition motif-containing protein